MQAQKEQARDLNPEPSYCMVTVLTTVPTCHPEIHYQCHLKSLVFGLKIFPEDIILFSR